MHISTRVIFIHLGEIDVNKFEKTAYNWYKFIKTFTDK